MSTPCLFRWRCRQGSAANPDHLVRWHPVKGLSLSQLQQLDSLPDCPAEVDHQWTRLLVRKQTPAVAVTIGAPGAFDYCLENDRGDYVGGFNSLVFPHADLEHGLNVLTFRGFSLGAVTALDMVAQGLEGFIDLRPFTGITDLQVQGNVLSALDLSASTSLLTMQAQGNDFRSFTVPGSLGALDMSSNLSLGQLSFAPSSQPMSSVVAENCLVPALDLSPRPMLAEADGFSLNLRNNSMSFEQVTVLLETLDANTTGGYINRSIILDGNNQAPDPTPAIASLQSKGFTLTLTP